MGACREVVEAQTAGLRIQSFHPGSTVGCMSFTKQDIEFGRNGTEGAFNSR